MFHQRDMTHGFLLCFVMQSRRIRLVAVAASGMSCGTRAFIPEGPLLRFGKKFSVQWQAALQLAVVLRCGAGERCALLKLPAQHRLAASEP